MSEKHYFGDVGEVEYVRLEQPNISSKTYYTKECVEKLQQRIAELEGQLKNAIVPPVKIGDKIYVVPSETNFKINNIHHKERNRIYEWEVHEIRFSKYGYAVVSWIDNIPFFCVDVETGKYDCGTYKTERFYGETWFKTKEEAQAKLQQMKGESDVKD